MYTSCACNVIYHKFFFPSLHTPPLTLLPFTFSLSLSLHLSLFFFSPLSASFFLYFPPSPSFPLPLSFPLPPSFPPSLFPSFSLSHSLLSSSQHLHSLEINSTDTVVAERQCRFVLKRADGSYTFKVYTHTYVLPGIHIHRGMPRAVRQNLMRVP